jgi:hypothetical protein
MGAFLLVVGGLAALAIMLTVGTKLWNVVARRQCWT